MPAPLWYKGICDQALYKVQMWMNAWPAGDVAATRPMLQTDGIHDVVTKRAVKVSWQTRELEHIVRILKESKPDWGLTMYMEQVLQGHKRSRMAPNGSYVCTMVSAYEDVVDIYKALINVRDGISEMSSIKQGLGPLWKL